jgi:hypothetical protein
MNHSYKFRQLSQSEQELMQMMLMEELEIQTWFTISASTMLGCEIFLTLQ